jgi:hypothetical protein
MFISSLLSVLAHFTVAHGAVQTSCDRLMSTSPSAIESIQAIRESSSQLKINPDGLIAFGPDGFPDRLSFAAAFGAHRLLARNASVPEADLPLLKRLEASFVLTNQFIFGGQNKALLEEEFESRGGFKAGGRLTWLEIIREHAFSNFSWWMRDDMNEITGRFFNPDNPARITYETTRSTVLKAAGPGSISRIFWSLDPPPRWRQFGESNIQWPDMMGPHVRVISDKHGNERSIEMFALKVTTKTTGWFRKTTTTHTEWRAFLFEKIGGEWIPRVNELNQNPATNCMTCHTTKDEAGNVVFTPRPEQLATADDFLAVGYKDKRVVEKFMEAFPR